MAALLQFIVRTKNLAKDMASQIGNRLLVVSVDNYAATMTDVQHDVHRFVRHSPHSAIRRQPYDVIVVAEEYCAAHVEIVVKDSAFHRGQARRLFFINYYPNVGAVDRDSEFNVFHVGCLQMCLSDDLKISHR
ncbi:hypothetical protein AP6_016 [Salmonella phage TS6]|uniref:Uncharacterized protein n=2 Tax=Cornellvirus TaxID=1910993 RepID=A0A7G3SZQ9_9CAUD|nr:hypothetical protein PF620_gp16 [Salmonella phage TS6]YP_010582345.1 hypothetical protein PF621_gp47 [Salmonella phage vB_SenTO17]AZF89059.1 hypothetical protein AP6_016 [Salmonella phage TS6]QJQ80430.1 hypothetical protein vBSenTO17_47 [Salmonella phage vB_SenTO17]